ncbi:hypothetical protein ACTHGU_11240 [Chitinophagaceae bacterium MMS25-I14]
MKKLILFGILGTGAFLTITSCHKGSSDSLAGKWALQKEHVVTVIKYFIPPEYDITDTTYAPGQYFAFYQFDGHGGFTASNQDSVVVTGNYAVFSSSKLGLKPQGGPVYDTLNYTLSGNTMTLSGVDTTTPLVESDYTLTWVKQ